MRRTRLAAVAAAVLVAALWSVPGRAAESRHRLGVGANYWIALDDIDVANVDDYGFGYVVSYQYRPSFFGFELAVDILPDRFGEDAYAPQAFLMVGRGLYAAIGVGIPYTDGEFADDPFYALKAGVNFELLPSVYFDISVQYRFSDWADLKDSDKKIDTDTVFLGAGVRVGF